MRRYANAPLLVSIGLAVAGLSSPVQTAGQPEQTLAAFVGSASRASEVFGTAGVTATIGPATEDPPVLVAAYRRALIDEYEQHGRRNATWDLAVTTGLGYLAREAAADPARPADANDQAWHWLKHAIDLGCDDPLVALLVAQLSEHDSAPQVAQARTVAARGAIERSTYAPHLETYDRIVAASASRAQHVVSMAEPCESVLPSYETFLNQYPDAVTKRGEYTQALMRCERWTEASAQFDILTPDRVRAGVFGGRAAYEHARLLASVRARREAAAR